MSEVAASKNRDLCASAEIGRQASLRCWCPSDVRVQVPPRAPRPRIFVIIELAAIIYEISFLIWLRSSEAERQPVTLEVGIS